MSKLFLSFVAIFLFFTSTSIAQDLNETKPFGHIENVSQTETILIDSTTINFSETESSNASEISDLNETKGSIIPSQGFSINSLWRGVLGMITLIFVAFLFSSNRKAIDWKIVGIGLAFQLLIAIGVLKVEFIKTIFDKEGKNLNLTFKSDSIMPIIADLFLFVYHYIYV